MNPDPEYWSIDFLGIDEQKAAAIIGELERLGLAESAIVADPESFLTLHLDLDTVIALDEALATSQPSKVAERGVDTLREAISHWLSMRGQQP